MICLSSTAIMTLMEDGSKIQFDSEALQTKLIKCCLMAGVKDFWIAEDLANAIESALSFQSEKGVLFSQKEIDKLISKMLDESGNHEIGAAFRTTLDSSLRDIDLSEYQNIKKAIAKTLLISNDELIKVSDKVFTACSELKIINAPQSLLVELAKFYRGDSKELPQISNVVVSPKSDSKWIISKMEILEKLSPQTRDLINIEMINFAGIGSIFPSIKIDMRFNALAKYYHLDPVTTELQFFPCFPIAIDALNEVIAVIRDNIPKLQFGSKPSDIPIYLKFSDIYFFAEKYFAIKLSIGEKFCKELAEAFADNLKYPVQTKIVKI